MFSVVHDDKILAKARTEKMLLKGLIQSVKSMLGVGIYCRTFSSVVSHKVVLRLGASCSSKSH